MNVPPEGVEVLELPAPRSQYGVMMEGQAMKVWVGLEMLCCRRKYEKNSCVSVAVYIVDGWDTASITVSLHDDYTENEQKIILSHTKAAEILRLQHALCDASIQGRTFRDTHIVLLDLDNPNVSMRDIITAMSRPTSGRYLHFGP